MKKVMMVLLDVITLWGCKKEGLGDAGFMLQTKQ
jgi:hypothetical protein